MPVRSLLVVLLFAALAVVACGGKIAPQDAGPEATCGAHQSTKAGSCASTDSVVCTDATYTVACDCPAGTCTCQKDGVATKSVPFSTCTCTPTRDALQAIYTACGYPY